MSNDSAERVYKAYDALMRKQRRNRRILMAIIAILTFTVVLSFACDNHPTGGGDEASMKVTAANFFPITFVSESGYFADSLGNQYTPVYYEFPSEPAQLNFYPTVTNPVTTIGITINGSFDVDVDIHPTGPAPLGLE